jgi:hypothetical protein
MQLLEAFVYGNYKHIALLMPVNHCIKDKDIISTNSPTSSISPDFDTSRQNTPNKRDKTVKKA